MGRMNLERAGLRRGVVVLLVGATMAVTGGCGSSSAVNTGTAAAGPAAVAPGTSGNSGSFVGKASNAAVFVTWTESAGQLSGELQQAILQTDSGSGQESVNNQSISFTGSMSGSSVTLSLNQGLGSTSNLTGTLNGGNLTLNYPGQNGNVITLQMQPGTASTYNQDLTALQSQAGNNNNQVQQAQTAQQHASQTTQDAQNVTSDLASMQSAAKSLAGTDYYSADLSAEHKDVAQTRSDMQTVLNEQGHTDAGSLCSDAGTVGSDVGTAQSDVGTIESDQGSSESDVSTVKNDLMQLQQADQALESDRSTDPGDVPGGAPSQGQVTAAVQAAQAAIAKAHRDATAALSQANALESTAAGYQSKSDAACKAAGG